jgi:hypothetical protein
MVIHSEPMTGEMKSKKLYKNISKDSSGMSGIIHDVLGIEKELTGLNKNLNPDYTVCSELIRYLKAMI